MNDSKALKFHATLAVGDHLVEGPFDFAAVCHLQCEIPSFPLLEAPEKVCLPHRVQRHEISALYAEKIELGPGCGVGRKRVE